MVPSCGFVVHMNHKKHMVEANVVYVRHKNTYGRGCPPFMCFWVVHMDPKTTQKWRENLFSAPNHITPLSLRPSLRLTTTTIPPPCPLLSLSLSLLSCTSHLLSLSLPLLGAAFQNAQKGACCDGSSPYNHIIRRVVALDGNGNRIVTDGDNHRTAVITTVRHN